MYINMKIIIAQGLLCVLFGVSTTTTTKTQLTTPRYNHDNDENLNFRNSNFKVNPVLKTEILKKDTNLRNNKYILFPAERSYKVKVEKSTSHINIPTKNVLFNLTKNAKFNRYFSGIKQKPVIQQMENLKRNKISSVRPRVKYKSNISKSEDIIINSDTVSKNKNKTHVVRNIQISAKVLAKQKPLTSAISKIKQSTYKNRSKLKIRPMNKQTNDIHPEIITFSPEFSINNMPIAGYEMTTQDVFPGIRPQIDTYSPGDSISDSLQNHDFSPNTSSKIPISQVILQSVPNSNTGTKDSLETDCPSFLISSNVFGPQRQGCSDLNVVINSHLNQNIVTETVPGIQPLSSQVETDAADEVAADTPEQLASPAAETSAANAPATAPAQPINSGTQGGGLPQLPGLPELSFPDLKGFFDLLGAIWRIISPIFGFLTNPYLYLVPAAISFIIGFLKIIGSFKLFVVIPALLLFGYVNRDKPPEVAYYKHVHKPIHHNNAWFWNHNTKTWKNIADFISTKHTHPTINKKS